MSTVCSLIARQTRTDHARSFAALRWGVMQIVAMSLMMTAPANAAEARVPEGVSASDWSSIRAAHEATRRAVDDSSEVHPLDFEPIAQQAYIKASNTGATDYFGYAVAISGDTMVVGAPGEDSAARVVNGDGSDNFRDGSGAAYVFVRSDGVWSQQAFLKAANADVSDAFGSSVAISGDTIVVGAPGEDSIATGVNGNGADNSVSGTNSGAAYVFVRSGTTWTQQAYLKASNTGMNDSFAVAVAVNGDTVVVGAYLEDSNATGVNGNQADNSAADSGAVYIFSRSGTVWSQQAYIKASNTGAGDRFGNSVALSGNTVVIGAYFEDSNATGVNGNQANDSASNAGAVYVFVRSGTTWSQQAYLKASNTGANDTFGVSVSVSGDTVVVGANGEDSNATGVNGIQANESAFSSGAAYVFVRSSGVWNQQAYLKASNTGAIDNFGYTVTVSGDTVVVGAPGEDSNATGVDGNQADNNGADSGAAYVFTRSGTVWSQQSYLKASNTDEGDSFGWSVAIDGSTVLVGANLENSNATGVNGNQASNSASDSGAVYEFLIPAPCPSDLDGSGEVDGGDVGLMLLDFGPCAGCPSDLDGSGEVDGADVGLMLLDFGPCP